MANLTLAIAEAERALELGKRANAYLSAEGREAYRTGLIIGATSSVVMDDYTVFHEFDELKSKTLMQSVQNGNQLAKESILKIIAEYIQFKKPLPATLGDYLLNALDHSATKAKPGKRPHSHHYRDLYIGMAVWSVMQCGFQRERNPASRDKIDSACSIVAAVLASKFGINLSEDMVKKASDTWRHLEL